MPGSVLGTGDTAVGKQIKNRVPACMEQTYLQGNKDNSKNQRVKARGLSVL